MSGGPGRLSEGFGPSCGLLLPSSLATSGTIQQQLLRTRREAGNVYADKSLLLEASPFADSGRDLTRLYPMTRRDIRDSISLHQTLHTRSPFTSILYMTCRPPFRKVLIWRPPCRRRDRARKIKGNITWPAIGSCRRSDRTSFFSDETVRRQRKESLNCVSTQRHSPVPLTPFLVSLLRFAAHADHSSPRGAYLLQTFGPERSVGSAVPTLYIFEFFRVSVLEPSCAIVIPWSDVWRFNRW